MYYEQKKKKKKNQRCFAIPESKTHFAIFIPGDINKYTLYMYCNSKLFKKYFASNQFCNVVNQVREGVKVILKIKFRILNIILKDIM